MNKKFIKKIFIFFLFFLPLQYAIAGWVGVIKKQPWPALVLPAFKSVIPNKVIWKPKFTVETENGPYNLDYHVLFNELGNSQQWSFIEANFLDPRQTNEFNTQTRRWLKIQIQSHLPVSSEARALDIQWIKKTFKKNNESVDDYSETIVKGSHIIIPFK